MVLVLDCKQAVGDGGDGGAGVEIVDVELVGAAAAGLAGVVALTAVDVSAVSPAGVKRLGCSSACLVAVGLLAVVVR